MAKAPVDHTPPTLPPGATKTAPTWRAAYSDRTAALMAALSQLAYVPFEAVRSPVPRQPKPMRPGGRDALAEYLGPDFTSLQLFNKDDTQAFLAVSPDFAVLSFRGTANFEDWITNLDAVLVPLEDAPADVYVHQGFLSAFNCCRSEIKAAVDENVGPDLGLYITGHSLGGALAQIASAVLERDNLAACYTFGSPRVGTLDFDVQVKCPHYRLTNDWDIVPGVPPPWNSGYHHTGDPRLLKTGPKLFRRDRGVVSRFLVDLVASIAGLFSNRFLAIDDHMIWNYRAGLDQLSSERGGRQTSQPGVQPQVARLGPASASLEAEVVAGRSVQLVPMALIFGVTTVIAIAASSRLRSRAPANSMRLT